ncbi:NADPH:quinone reductase, partial [Jatrophihabitans endophyticus]|uniref:NADPH:quinone reductase n=1 Tax=Jatrophihabitans endophyticus TaxID=1206085 RepID=UPI001A0DA89E
MRAAWFDTQGPASEVLQVGELPQPEPGLNEVRVRLTYSGVNPGDVKKRQAWLDSPMAFSRIVPHSDGAGVVDAIGRDVDRAHVGDRVWVRGAQSYRPFGTAAEYTVIPAEQVTLLPPNVPDEVGACLGIPGVTAHRAVFADGPVHGDVVLVHGVRGAVGSMAAQLARWGGATVIGTVRTTHEVDDVPAGTADHVVALDVASPADRIRELAPDGVARIVEVALGANIDLDDAVLANGGYIAAYASNTDRPPIPFWTLLFNNAVL